ncbi:Beta-lactamase class C and other penicillin binding protein [Myxococcus hansupus]|uniref:Beta-lactamase class C and other penicillin binding protein n=1 Tax=Pseudomyxococcus hansupus TaxID=1297742 RepID=A0A0H4WK39_9BACT|nr:serine hydrolase domain-containing protein [Myxococcus hansupus]AKQ63721.1 Beta-lactamase class C and other penicillin binding protein [Myxococcus hansupus]
MNALRVWSLSVLFAAGCATAPAPRETPPIPDAAALDGEMKRAMAATGAKGLALAVIDDGRVVATRAHGWRNAQGEPLRTDTVMYGASITKTVFAYLVAQLADEARLDLDTSIERYLDRPLPDYADEDRYSTWSHLTGDSRWKAITPRILLTHSAGFANFGFLEPDGKLRIHFAPGSRYAYSGDGIILMQFVLERGLGLDVGTELQQRVFDRLGMRNTSMTWRPDFAHNLADGWTAEGGVEPHDERSKVRAAGSMDTTIDDLSRFAAALVRGEGLSPQAFAAMTAPRLPITTRSQFPTLQAELPEAARRKDLAAGLGLVVFEGPQGPAFFKGGHNESTGNTLVCVSRGRRCVLLLANDVRAEAAFPRLVRFVLGDAGVPWGWEYGPKTFWDGR